MYIGKFNQKRRCSLVIMYTEKVMILQNEKHLLHSFLNFGSELCGITHNICSIACWSVVNPYFLIKVCSVLTLLIRAVGTTLNEIVCLVLKNECMFVQVTIATGGFIMVCDIFIMTAFHFIRFAYLL